MASNRERFSDFFADDDDESFVDTRPDGRLMKVPLGRISPNGVNPRTYFGTDQDLQELGNSLRRRQHQALPVVSLSAYLKLWPEHEAKVGSVDVVIVSGERRYRGASKVGLPALTVVIDDAVAESRQTFINAVVTENVARENFDPIEEAMALEALVTEYGTASAVAENFDKSNGWVSQRRLLLRLAPQMQTLVRTRAMPVESARALAALVKKHEWDAGAQELWWADAQRARAEAAEASALRRQQRRAPRQAEPPPPPSAPVSAVPDSGLLVFTAVKTSERPEAVPAVPEAAASGRTSEPEPAVVPARTRQPDPVPPSAAPAPSGTGGGAVPQQSREQPPPVPAQERDSQATGDGRTWSAAAEEEGRRLVGEYGYNDRRRIVMILLEANEREEVTATS